MGNSFHAPVHNPETLSILRRDEEKHIISICLLCHQDGMETDMGIIKTKENIREFIRSIYTNHEDMVFSWTTWDIKDSDIVMEKNDMSGTPPVFDVSVSMGCPFANLPLEHFQKMCSMLKPNGIAVVSAPRKYFNRAFSIFEEFRKDNGFPMLTCGNGVELKPVYRTDGKKRAFAIYIKN